MFSRRFVTFAPVLFAWLAPLLPASSMAAGDSLQALVARAEAMQLAQSRAWRALLHYKPGGLFHQWESQADDDAFFLSANGKYEPQQELEATIRAMAQPPGDDVNQHPQCRFPARYHWLKQQLKIDPAVIKPVYCEQLQTWFDTLRPGSLTLVFPAAYINSPSSMFGHTLLRVNPDDYRKNSALVAYALNYAANADATDNALLFSIKGLIGGYPGVFSIVPYYEKIKEYRDLENRDVWEYELDFSKDELYQLMRHAWEVRHIQFDYYFLTENCSYHMLSLMEAARPSLDLTSHFEVKAIPADTVRVVFDNNLVTDVRYRPSSTTIIKQHAAQMSEQDNELAIALTEIDYAKLARQIESRPVEARARILEQAYDYARFLATADPTVRDPRAATNWRLLAERSKLGVKNVWRPITTPAVRSEQGHKTARLAIAAGALQQDSYLALHLRPAYHDVLDPPQGYSKASQINFLDTQLRYYIDSQSLQLQKLTFINVLSLAPQDAYFDPIAWGVDVAIERQPTRSAWTNAAQLVVNGGFSTEIAGTVNVSILAEANLKAANRFEKGYSAGVGLKAGLLYQSERMSFELSVKAVDFAAGEENLHQQAAIGLSVHRGVNQSVRLSAVRRRDYERYQSDVQLGWHLYF